MQRHRTGTADHAAQPGWLSAALVKVGSDATAQIQGFTDIEHSASGIAKEIDPWLLGELGEIRPPGVMHDVRSVPRPSPLAGDGQNCPQERLPVVGAISMFYNGSNGSVVHVRRWSDRVSVQYPWKAQPLSRTPSSSLVMTRCAAR